MSECRKIRYESRREARRAARQIPHIGHALSAYHCDDCGYWHHTSRSADVKTSWRERDYGTAS